MEIPFATLRLLGSFVVAAPAGSFGAAASGGGFAAAAAPAVREVSLLLAAFREVLLVVG